MHDAPRMHRILLDCRPQSHNTLCESRVVADTPWPDACHQHRRTDDTLRAFNQDAQYAELSGRQTDLAAWQEDFVAGQVNAEVAGLKHAL